MRVHLCAKLTAVRSSVDGLQSRMGESGTASGSTSFRWLMKTNYRGVVVSEVGASQQDVRQLQIVNIIHERFMQHA